MTDKEHIRVIKATYPGCFCMDLTMPYNSFKEYAIIIFDESKGTGGRFRFLSSRFATEDEAWKNSWDVLNKEMMNRLSK